jgi:hypothetical protein
MGKIAEKEDKAHAARVTRVALSALRIDEAVKSAANESPEVSPEVSPERQASGRRAANCLGGRVSARFEVAFGVEIDLAQLVQGLGVW